MYTIDHNNNPCQEQSAYFDADYPNYYQINREFLGDCTEFIKNINNLEDSPWKNDSIVRWSAGEKRIFLGQSQRKVLQFLQSKFFSKDQPCFVKQVFIARKLNMYRSQVNRILKDLENKGLIVRITWLYKGRRKNALTLPLIPSISPLFTEKNNLPKPDFQDCYHKYNSLFCKPPKSQKFPKPFILYTHILYINKLFKFNKVTLNSIQSEEYTVLSRTGASPSDVATHPADSEDSDPTHVDSKTTPLINKLVLVKKKEPPLVPQEKEDSDMVNKFLLKRKEREGDNACQPIFNQLKLRSSYNFDKLSIEHQNQLNTYVDFFHGIDIRTHFKISQRNANAGYNDLAICLRAELLQIIANGYELQWEFADKVIEHWNNVEINDKRFQRINIGQRTTKAYINAVIAISHCLIFKANSSYDALFTAIDRLPYAQSKRKFPFNSRYKISIQAFFANPSNRIYLEKHLAPDIEWQRYVFEYSVSKDNKERVKIAYDRFVELYVDQFNPNSTDKGKEKCYRFEFMIKQFLDRRINEIVSNGYHTRNMEGYSLINDVIDTDGSPLPPLLQRFFFYYARPENFEYQKTRFVDMLSDQAWKDFIETHMRIEVGLTDFYKLKKS